MALRLVPFPGIDAQSVYEDSKDYNAYALILSAELLDTALLLFLYWNFICA
jgi:hypothetical protein